MKRKFVLALVPALLAATFASSLAATDAATAEGLLRDTGLWRELGETAAQVQASLHRYVDEAPKKPEPAEVARLERIIDTVFAPERLRVVASDVIEEKAGEQYLPVLQEWFASADGKAIAKAEAASSSTLEAQEKLKRDGIVLLEKMPESRRLLLDGILAASRSTEIATTIAIGSALAIVRAVHRSNPDLPLPAEGDLRAQLEGGRSRIEGALYPGFLEMYASIYQGISDDRLQRYADLLVSASGRHMIDVLAQAIEATMVDGAERLWRAILPAGGEGTTT